MKNPLQSLPHDIMMNIVAKTSTSDRASLRSTGRALKFSVDNYAPEYSTHSQLIFACQSHSHSIFKILYNFNLREPKAFFMLEQMDMMCLKAIGLLCSTHFEKNSLNKLYPIPVNLSLDSNRDGRRRLELISSCPLLLGLNLSNNHQLDITDSVFELLPQLKLYHIQLLSVDLSVNNYRFNQFMQTIKNNKRTLSTLVLSDNRLNNEHMEKLMLELAGTPNVLRYLMITVAHLGKSATNAFEMYLKSPNNHLYRLDLNQLMFIDNSDHDKDTDLLYFFDIYSYLLNALRQAKTLKLKELTLEGINLAGYPLNMLISLLKSNNNHIKKLNIALTGLYDSSAEVLVKDYLMSGDCQLEVLNLSQSKSWWAIIRNRNIMIDLFSNMIGVDGISSLVDAAVNSSLKELRLPRRLLSEQAVFQLILSASQNPDLRLHLD